MPETSTDMTILQQAELEAQNRALREAQSQLEESRSRFADLYDLAPVAYCSFDAAGCIREINLTGTAMMGIDRRQLVGQPFTSVVKLRDPSVFRRHLRICFRERSPVTSEVVFNVKRGGTVVALMASMPIFANDGHVIACRSAFTDLTELRRAEQERLRLLERAEEARKLAESANRAKDEFLATVSHELRTPLAAMLMWTGVLRSVSDEDTRQRALDSLDLSVRAQSKLIDDLIDVSRGMNGKLRLEMRTVDLAVVLHESVRAIAPTFSSRGIELDVDAGAPGAVVHGDPNRLQQVIGNLLSNALKFTPRGGHVRLRLRRDGGRVTLTVADDGEGIESDFLPHVFEPFRQQDGTSTRAHGGLGLGLAIARELMVLHNGSVKAESPGPGRGATFTITLPHDQGTVPDIEPPPPPQPVLLEGVRVLVVDDHISTLDGFARILRRHGAEVLTASSSEEALQLLQRHTIDALLSDIAMPGEDGYTLLRRLRAREVPLGRLTPAAALTARTSAKDRDEALRAGFQLHVAKPLEPLTLLTVVAQLAGRREFTSK
jgi:PAS domain S-box-containing protein